MRYHQAWLLLKVKLLVLPGVRSAVLLRYYVSVLYFFYLKNEFFTVCNLCLGLRNFLYFKTLFFALVVMIFLFLEMDNLGVGIAGIPLYGCDSLRRYLCAKNRSN